MTNVVNDAVPLAEVDRGELVESVHLGHLAALDGSGKSVLSLGNPDVVIWPRSSVKPLQAVAMVRNGLDLPERLLALAAASHNGDPEHLAGVREILDLVDLDEDDLLNTPDLPMSRSAALAWLVAEGGPAHITQNCSGKHAAMLATCRAAGWDTKTYLNPDHPLQVAIREVMGEFTGVPVPMATIDGCGAPLFATTVTGLATAFARLGAAPTVAPDAPEAAVARAMSAHPDMVAGDRRPNTIAMHAVPGLVAKDGADGVFAAALPDGSAVAFKVLDGGERPFGVTLVAALELLGVHHVEGVDEAALDELGERPILGGGEPVGILRPTFG